MISYIRRQMSRRLLLMENRILLSILIRLFMRYQAKANSLNKYSNPTSVWYGTQHTEDNLLSQCLRVLERRLQANLEEAETLAATAKDGMTKSDSKKGYIENQLKFDRETARIAAAKMWKNSAGGAPVFGS